MRVCSECIKNDVCNIQDQFAKAVSDITDIKGRTNIFMDIDVNCKKFAKKQPDFVSRDISA